MRAKNDICADAVRAILSYDPKTGIFRWRKRLAQRVHEGDVAGCPNNSGHLHIQIRGRKYKAHRLAWLVSYGRWPEQEIDHINRVRDDNRIANLREVTAAQNAQNATLYRSNTTGFRGVYVRNGRIFSQIRAHGKTIRLGVFESMEDAAKAFAAAKRELHPFAAEYSK